MRALVVDDSRAIRTIMKNILRGLNIEAIEAGNGVEALARLNELTRVGLALVDWNMPEMNGFELVKAIRAKPEYDAMRIIMVTTETEVPRMEAALAAGANEYLMKPFTKDALCDKLSIVGLIS